MKTTIKCLACFLAIIFLFGCGGSDQKEKTRKAIVFGSVLVLTGPDAYTGESAQEGIQLAVQEINSAGGIKGDTLRVIYEDDEGEPQKAVSAVNKLIDINKVDLIIGPLFSNCVLSVAPIVEKRKVVLISPTASSPKITDAGDFVFRNTYSDVFEGQKTAEYTYRELNIRNSGILYINNEYGKGLNDVFAEKFEELGGKILLSSAYSPDTKDFKTILVKFKEKNLDGIYLIGLSELGQVLKQMKEIALKVQLVSTIMFEISDIVDIAKENAEGVHYAFPSYDPNFGDSLIQSFSRKYKNNFGKLPNPEAAFSYDAIKIAVQVLKAGALSSEQIKDSLYNITYYGITGKTSFDKNGDVINKPIGFKRVQDGRYVWTKPIY